MGEHVTTSLGAYLLGALPPAERAEVDEHLTGCAGCRDELAPLAGLPGLLSRLSPDDLADDPTPLQPAPDRRAPRRRRLLAAAAALALLLSGGAVALALRSGGPPAGRTVTAQDASGTRLRVTLAGRPWGTALGLRVSGVPAGTRCRVVVVDTGGRAEAAGSWLAGYDGSADVSAATAVPVAQIASVQVVTDTGRRLVTARLRQAEGP